MKPLFDFLIKLCILTVILWGVIIWGVAPGTIDLKSVFIAWVMIFVNTLSGYLLFEYAFERDSSSFNKVVFGGLTFRLLVMMLLVGVILVGNYVSDYDFVLSFFAFYCIYVIVEILGYQKKNKQKKNIA